MLEQELRHTVGDTHDLVDPSVKASYETDWTDRLRGEPWAVFVAVGGGSSIDTAKAINVLTSNPAS